jgi:tetratricopeptide (TPR) repeat protein
MVNLILISVVLLGCAAGGKTKNGTPGNSVAKNGAEGVKIATLDVQDREKYEEIKQLILNDDFPRAEAKLRNFVLKYPEFAGAWANLGVVYSQTGRLDQAEKALQKAIELDSSIAPVYVRLAFVYRNQGKIQDAVEAYEKSLEKNPQYASAHYNLALLYDLYLQEPDKALQHLQRYIALTDTKEKDTQAWLKQMEKAVKDEKVDGQSISVQEQPPTQPIGESPSPTPR